MNKNLKLAQSGASPSIYFVRQDKNIFHGVFPKKKDRADKSISEAITTPSFGDGRGVSVKKKIFETCPKWRKPLRGFFSDKKTN